MRLAAFFAALLLAASGAQAQEKVQFPSLDGKGRPATMLDGYLFKPARAPPPYPVVVFQHGCGGLISPISHAIMSRELAWADKLNQQGIGVLMIDSFTPRGSGEECSRSGFREAVYLSRPADAYGALRWLQSQPDVARDRIGLMGWSNGGGSVLFAIRKRSLGRPADFAGPDFRAAVAFYPGSCSEKRAGADWTTTIPLLILIGAKDVWTPAAPCKALADGAVARGAPVEFHAYDDAYHDFDWPNLKRRELTAYTTRDGVVPITGEDPAARADAVRRVESFLAARLLH